MKKLLKFLSGRIFIGIVLIAIQLGWFVVFLFKLTKYSIPLEIFFTVLSLLIVMVLVKSDENPTYKTAWVILIMAIPLAGGLLYITAGNKRPSKHLRQKLDGTREALAPHLTQNPAVTQALKEKNIRAASSMNYLCGENNFPVYQNTDTTYYALGDDLYKDLLVSLESAQHFIFMEYFIIRQPSVVWDAIFDILKRKVAQGVIVRLIYDDMGSMFLVTPEFQKMLEQNGIACIAFNPFIPIASLIMNNRNHRKMTIIDGHTVFTGGINLSDEYINLTHPHGHWKDTGVRLFGGATWNFTIMFLEFWHAFCLKDADEDVTQFQPQKWHPEEFPSDESGFIQPFCDSPLDNEPISERVYSDILAQASDYVYIYTPYLVIDDVMKTALYAAAKRGVDVRIVTPGIPDKKLVYRLTRSYYPPLLRAGVRIFEYTPGFMHAKSFVADDKLGVIGTINMDCRSLYLHFECGVYFYNDPVIYDLKQDVQETFEKSREVQLSDCRQGLWGSLLDSILRLFAPLF